jgi:hypothetical protein
MQPDGSDYTVIHHFHAPLGKNPKGKLMPDVNDLLYGTTPLGGPGGVGIVYRVNDIGTWFQKVADLNNTGGQIRPNIAIDEYSFVYALNSNFTIHKYATWNGELINTGPEFGSITRIPTSVACDTYVTSIADNATGVPTSVTVALKEMTGAEKYFLDVSTDAEFDTYQRHVSPTNEVSLELNANTTYYTRVFTSLLPDPGPTISFTTGAASGRLAMKGEKNISSSLTVYPNPSRDGFNLSVDPSELRSVVMTEANGNIVYQYQNRTGQLPERFGSGLARGVYFLRIQTAAGVQTLRVVKQ